MDLVNEFTRRGRSALRPEIPPKGQPLASGPNQPLPPLVKLGIDDSTRKQITQEMADTVLQITYDRRPDLWLAFSEEHRHEEVFIRSTARDTPPDFSPDGNRIAFVSSRSGTPEIWACDADGGNPRQLTHLSPYLISYPKWSPDGTRIAFHARVPDVAEIYVVDVNEGVPHQITHANPGLALPTWSNDGRYLYASTLIGARGCRTDLQPQVDP